MRMSQRSLFVLGLAAMLSLTMPVKSPAQDAAPVSNSPNATLGRRDLVGALADSLKLVMMEHGLRIAFQPKPRAELGGPFWADYRQSVRIPQQWQDGDS